MTTATRTMTPVNITQRYPNWRGTRLENWAAESVDGEWKYERIEDTGTPWDVVHVPSGLSAGWWSSLPKARAATADGTAMAAVERLQAHDRGEHAERVPMCGRC